MSDKPSKERVRHVMADRAKSRKPLPGLKEWRRILGIDLINALRKKPKR